MSVKRIIAGIILFWFFSIFYATITIEGRVFDGGHLISEPGSRTLLVWAAPLLFFASILISIRYAKDMAYLIRKSASLLMLFVLVGALLVNSVILMRWQSVVYVLLFGSSLVVTLYANVVFGPRFFWRTTIAVTAALVSFLVILGFPEGRWIGGIHPNHVGAFALLAAFFAASSNHNWRWFVYLIALAFGLLVSSRYAVLAVLVIILADYFSNVSRLNNTRVLGMILLSMVLLVFLFYRFDLVTSWLALDDPWRGIGSGFTGRIDSWQYFLPQILERPFFGYGFRQRQNYEGTHNGFLNFALENGLIVTLVLFLWILSVASLGLKAISKQNRVSRDTLTIGGAWVAWGVVGFFQPQLVNFGDAFGVMTAFLFTAHVKWIISSDIKEK